MRRPRPVLARTCSRPRRRGVALMDVIVGGVMLGIGLSVVLSLASRSLNRQTDGEKRLVASWLADELLGMVLVEGPVEYPRVHDTNGRFKPPFDDFGFELEIKDQGLGQPFDVNVFIRWPYGEPVTEIHVQTLMAVRRGAVDEPREPLDWIDRDARYFDDEFDR